ncbi:hypothetical protein AQUCO_00700713v1 [Aquilegia coerulea]|uniref:RING-type E3 ubiquitin transferase n=1 Tax=Aquilegia coerulea TaxID=218851 RepID=A0A2G5ELC9_AQUCA|nr:hypothetical protein AQUCO_00700713v1 [Aquilegia coerulea]
MEIAVETSNSNSTDEERINSNSIESVGTSSSSNKKIEISGKYEEEDDEEDVCRICRNTGDVENPLRYPCACSGSIKFVHQDCLLQWLNHSNARKCEVCKHPFSFSPVYAENAPARLPFQEFLVGMAMKACHVLQFVLRLAFVLSVWLLIIPFITFWIWRLSFVRSFREAHRLFLTHVSTTVILTDCLHGFLLSASIVFIFLGATSLRDYFRHLRELGGQDEREDEGDRNGARAARRPPAPPNRINDGDGNGEDVGGGQGMAGAGQLIRRNAENVAARLEMQAARLEAHVEQMFDGLDDADGAEDVPFDELVGMQGPVFHLVENAFTVLASNLIFLGVVIFIPFSFGRIVVHYLSWLFSVTTNPLLSAAVPLTESALSLANTTLKSALIDNHVVEAVAETLKANITELDRVSNSIGNPLSADILNGAVVGTSRLSDVTTLAVGYMFQISLVVLYLEMLGKTIPQRVEFFSSSPLASSLLHWIVGIVYMLQISIFVSLLRGVLRSGVLYFLRDPADPNYNPFRDLIDDPVHKHARRVLLSVAVYGSLIVVLVFLPVKFAMRLAPTVFPLDISVSDPFTEIPADMLLFQICIPFAIEHFKLRTTIKAFLRQWFTAVGWALGLNDFLLPRPEDSRQEAGNEEGNDRLRDAALMAPEVQNRVMLTSGNDDDTEEYDAEEHTNSEYGFILRIVLLLILAWMTLLLCNAALIVVPISLGRALFSTIPILPITHGIKCNDLYSFIIGSYAIWAILAGARYCIEHVKTRRAGILLNRVWKWSAIVLKSSGLLAIWVK